jgi:glycosyltransferase involved in cell wall biosynthesis
MTTTCLINNFNYAGFLGDAIDSALRQTVPFDQIVVVDDGSTDGSLELLARKRAGHPVVEVVAKENQGQLSCFNEGLARARGDIVFFLDADDLYEPTYVEQALSVYGKTGCDFVSCGYREFGRSDRVQLRHPTDRDLGYSVVLTSQLREWIGAPTSCLSMRRGVLEKILPLPCVDDWRTRADDCLVFGASLAAARKYYLAQPLVRYRVHAVNQVCGRLPDRFAVYRRRLAINRLFEHLERKFCYDTARLADFHHREFCTIERPTLRELLKYLRITMAARLSPARRMGCFLEMSRHFVAARLARANRPAPSSEGHDAARLLRLPSVEERAVDAGPAHTHAAQRAA